MSFINAESGYVLWGGSQAWDAWQHQTEKKLKSFLLRNISRISDDERATIERNCEIALALHKAAQGLGFFKTNAFPGDAGEIALTITEDMHSLEFVIEVDSSITFSEEVENEVVEYEEGLNQQQAETILRNFRVKQTWNLLDFSKALSSTGMNPDSINLPSGIILNPMQMVQSEPQLSLGTAFAIVALPSANISVNITPSLSKKGKPDFGASHRTYFQVAT